MNANTVVRGRKHSTENTEIYFGFTLIGKVVSPFLLSYPWAVLTLPVYRGGEENGGGGRPFLNEKVLHIKGRHYLQDRFLRNMFLRFSNPKTLYFAEQIFVNRVQFLNAFFENCRVFRKSFNFLYFCGKNVCK